MDFKDLYEKAKKNVKKSEKKVREADHELHSRRRLQIERIANERTREKQEMQRKLIQKQALSLNNQKQNVIAVAKSKTERNGLGTERRINHEKIDNKNINKFSNVQSFTSYNQSNERTNGKNAIQKHEQAINHAKPKLQTQKQKPDNRGMPASQNFEELLKQAEQNNNSSAVEELFSKIESTSAIIPMKKAKLTPPETFGITSGLNLTSAVREKQRITKGNENVAHKTLKTQQRQQSKPASIPTTSSLKRKNERNNSFFPTTQNIKPDSEKQTRNICMSKDLSKAKQIRSDKLAITCRDGKFHNKDVKKCNIPAMPSTNKSETQRRYLPGDIRFKDAAKNSGKVSINKNLPNPNYPALDQHADINKKNSSNPQSTNHTFTKKVQQIEKMKQPAKQTSQQNTKLACQFKLSSGYKKELPIKNNKMLNRKTINSYEKSKMVAGKNLSEPDNNLARIKRGVILRREMTQQQQQQRGREHGIYRSSAASSSSVRKYANYSETDEEDDDDIGHYDDEYDSDLADFIDDSVVDDLQREDLEETLRIINPRYNKKKWLMREQMIDDRKMDVRFKDVELEERRSAKLGLVEDLIEAKRGSKALA